MLYAHMYWPKMAVAEGRECDQCSVVNGLLCGVVYHGCNGLREGYWHLAVLRSVGMTAFLHRCRVRNKIFLGLISGVSCKCTAQGQ